MPTRALSPSPRRPPTVENNILRLEVSHTHFANPSSFALWLAVENNILRVGEQQTMLENQRATVLTVGALQEAAQASKATMQEMKIENVDKVLDDVSGGWGVE